MDDIELIGLPKQYDGVVHAETKATHSAFKVIYFRPLDEDRVSIPGLSIEITIRTGLVVDRCKYTFTLFMLSQRKKHRVYQLEVVPADKRSHNGPPRIYGPHEHYGDSGDVRPVQNSLCCSDYKEWLNLFCQRINLRLSSELPYPFGDDDGMQLVNK